MLMLDTTVGAPGTLQHLSVLSSSSPYLPATAALAGGGDKLGRVFVLLQYRPRFLGAGELLPESRGAEAAAKDAKQKQKDKRKKKKGKDDEQPSSSSDSDSSSSSSDSDSGTSSSDSASSSSSGTSPTLCRKLSHLTFGVW